MTGIETTAGEWEAVKLYMYVSETFLRLTGFLTMFFYDKFLKNSMVQARDTQPGFKREPHTWRWLLCDNHNLQHTY